MLKKKFETMFKVVGYKVLKTWNCSKTNLFTNISEGKWWKKNAHEKNLQL